MLITFEGIDGSGKSSQIQRIAEYLSDRYVLITHQPGGSIIGDQIRSIILNSVMLDNRTELLLYLADRSYHCNTVIRPALDRGTIVLCDRYTDSTLAYQGYGRGFDMYDLAMFSNFADYRITPQLTFLFDLDAQIAQSRLQSSKDRLESEDIAFHTRVREGYLKLTSFESRSNRWRIIDATQPEDVIFEQLKLYIDSILI